jgi:hypothetical protein
MAARHGALERAAMQRRGEALFRIFAESDKPFFTLIS